VAAKKSNATRVGYAPNAIVPGCNHGRGLAWAFGEQEASRNVKSIAGGTNSNREDQSEIHSWRNIRYEPANGQAHGGKCE